MTLIVGRIIKDNIFLESDTKVTDNSAAYVDPLVGTLKIIIIHPLICLSFAGKIHFAEKAVKQIFSHKNLNISNILTILYSANKDSIKASNGNSDLETDFVLALIINKRPKLIKIANSRIEENIQNLWLGDKKAFNTYQQHYHNFINKDTPINQCIHSAFKRVVEDESIETVGNFQISVHSDDKTFINQKVFRYTLKTEISINVNQTFSSKVGNKVPISLGTNAGGSYGISYLVSVSPYLHGVALHFLHGNFGVLFCPQISENGIIIKNVSGEEFAKAMKDKYKISLQGFVKTNDYGIKLIDTSDKNDKN